MQAPKAAGDEKLGTAMADGVKPAQGNSVAKARSSQSWPAAALTCGAAGSRLGPAMRSCDR